MVVEQTEEELREKRLARRRELHSLNKERENARNRAYYAKNKEAVLKQKKQYALKNYEIIKKCKQKWNAENADRVSMMRKIRRERNIERETLKQREYRELNREKILAYASEYAKNNKPRRTYNQNKRHAAKLMATPSWASKEAMLLEYELAAWCSEATGESYQVDHIVPLQSKLVCGLHCEFNLRVIRRHENVRKSNVQWPDMP